MKRVPNIEQSAAPALSRGLAALRALSDRRPRRLEDLARELAVPKSTLLRLLTVLVDEGLLSRDPTSREYSAVSRLVPVGGGLDDRARARDAMAELLDATGRTIEWYVPNAAGLVLTERAADTTGEVRVQAQIGFLREWANELDAVAAVGLAFFHRLRKWSGLWTYRPSGQRCVLRAAEANERVDEARETGLIGDDELNANGVRRSAAVVGLSGGPWGVLAVAEFVGPGNPDQRGDYRAALVETARKLTTGAWPPEPKQG